MAQAQTLPKIFLGLLIYGDTLKIEGTKPTPADITRLLGVEPTTATHEDDVFIWEHMLAEESAWELPELIYSMLEKFDPEKVKQFTDKYGLEAGIKVAVYVNAGDNPTMYPDTYFSPSLVEKMSSFGASLDIDIIGYADKP